MKFKKIWKQMNRGIVVAGILIIGITIYTVVDNAIFRKEAPSIEKEFRDYAKEFTEANMDSEAFIESGAHWDEKQLEEKEKSVSNLLDQYWTQKKYNTGINGGGNTKDSLLLEIISSQKDKFGRDSYIKQASTNISKVKVKKNGPNGAMLTCDISALFTTYGGCALFLPNGDVEYVENDNYERENWDPTTEKDTEKIESLQEKKWKVSGSYVFYYLRVNGKWKIAAADWSSSAVEYLTDSNLDDMGGEKEWK